MATGWDLWSTLAQQAADKAYFDSAQPMACPNDGEPLRPGPESEPGVLFCVYDGFQYPRDWNPAVHSGM